MRRRMSDLSPRNGMSTERVGGSNGLAENVDMKSLLKFLHYPGSSPRQSRGTVYVLKGKTCYLFYVKPYQVKHEVTSHKYAIPVKASQVRLSVKKMRESSDTARSGIMKTQASFVESKVVMGCVLDSLNERIKSQGWLSVVSSQDKKKMKRHNHCTIASEAVAVQKATNSAIARQRAGDVDNKIERVSTHHAMVPVYSLVETPLFRHQDNTRPHPYFPEASAFLESKIVLVDHELSRNPGRHGDDLPRGRGGAGPGLHVFAGACASLRL